MKTFLYFLCFMYPTWWRRIRTKTEDMPFLEFERADYTILLVRPKLLKSKRQILKSLKKLRGNQRVSPLGIKVWQRESVYKTNADLLEDLISPNSISYSPVAVPMKIVSKLSDVSYDWLDYGALSVYQQSPASGIDKLEEVLSDTWKAVQYKLGKTDDKCEGCGYVGPSDSDDECRSCGRDKPVLENVPTTNAKYYEEIVAYEQSTGKSLLPRVDETSNF